MQIFYFSKKKIKRVLVFIIIIIILLLCIYKVFENSIYVPSFTYQDNRFSNQTIVIDAGHGGVDSGVVHSSGLMEKDVNLEIAKHLQGLLEDSGANVVITREEDVELSSLSTIGGTRQQRDLNARTNIIDNNQADFFVSVHVNSLPQHPSVKGPIIYYHPQSETSKTLAEVIQNRLNIEYSKIYKEEINHTVRGEAYYILRNTNSPGVIAEVGFMSNQEDYTLLSKEKFRYFIAYQIYIALGEYLET